MLPLSLLLDFLPWVCIILKLTLPKNLRQWKCYILSSKRKKMIYYRCQLKLYVFNYSTETIKNNLLLLLLFKYFIYLFLEGRGGRKRGRETSVCGCLSHTLYWGPGLQPRHVPWLEIERETPCFAGPHSTHWAIPAMENLLLLFLILRKPWYFLSLSSDCKICIFNPRLKSTPSPKENGDEQDVVVGCCTGQVISRRPTCVCSHWNSDLTRFPHVRLLLQVASMLVLCGQCHHPFRKWPYALALGSGVHSGPLVNWFIWWKGAVEEKGLEHDPGGHPLLPTTSAPARAAWLRQGWELSELPFNRCSVGCNCNSAVSPGSILLRETTVFI